MDKEYADLVEAGLVHLVDRYGFEEVLDTLVMCYGRDRVLTSLKHPRGRPEADEDHLIHFDMARLLEDGKALTPTQAAQQAAPHASPNEIKRLVRKFKSYRG